MDKIFKLPQKNREPQYRWVRHFAWKPTAMGWGIEADPSYAWLWFYYELQTFGENGWEAMPGGPALALYPYPLNDIPDT